MRDPYERLRDIQEVIAQILKNTSQGRDFFYQNEILQGWVILQLVFIGEAVRAVPQDFRDLHPGIPWKQINAMRNILIHLYFEINLDRVWAVVENDIPPLKVSIDAILAEQETDSGETKV